MVANLALKHVDYEAQLIELPQEDVKWCTVTLSNVIKTGKRLEASVFDVESKKAYQILEQCKYEKTNLISPDGFVINAHYGGRLKRNYTSEWDSGAVGFIGSSEMLDTKPQPVKFMSSVKNNIESLRVKEGTVLISRSGTIGNLTVVNKTLSKLLISEHAIRLECKEYPGFVYAYLKSRTGQSLINSKIYGAVIQQIEPEHLADIPVPTPPNELKQKINNLIMHSFSIRDEANQLLDEANKLLINELELRPINKMGTKQFKNNMNVNNYSVKLSDLKGRFDASYHVPIVEAILESMKRKAEEITTLGDCRVSKRIILPGRFKRVFVEEGQGKVFIGGKQLFEIDPSNKKYLSIAKHKEKINKDLEIHENTILITRSGTIGKVNMTPKHWEHWIASEHIIRVVPANKEIAGYLAVFLSSDYGYHLLTRHTYGSVVDEIDNKHVSQTQVPFLKNKEIQCWINSLALQANKLRYDAYQAEQKALKIMDDEIILAR